MMRVKSDKQKMTDPENSSIICPVCFHRCSLSEGQTGLCGARANRGGRSVCVNYGHITSLALDPIEKKPLSDFYPGSFILSAGSYGCNLSCPFCQNHSISFARKGNISYRETSPEELAALAESLKEKGNIGIAFTYNEPTVSWEFVRDASKLSHERGMKNAVVTNGSVAVEILDEFLPYVDAFNVDLKAFSEEFYKMAGGDLETVKAFIREASSGAHVEITTLVIPGLNDSPAEIDALSSFIADIDPDMVLHLTRFFPQFKMTDKMPTDIRTLETLRDIALRHLKRVRLGNV